MVTVFELHFNLIGFGFDLLVVGIAY